MTVTLSHMTEKQVTRAFFNGKVTEKQYKNRLMQIATRRHAKDIGSRKYRPSMSSTSWRR